MKRPGEREHDAVAEAVIEQVSDHLAEHDAAHRPAETDEAGDRPTALRGYMSAGRIITSVDHDCCPKYATLKMASASRPARSDEQDERHHRGARAKRDLPRRSSDCRVAASSIATADEAADAGRRIGIHAKRPTALMSNPRAS